MVKLKIITVYETVVEGLSPSVGAYASVAQQSRASDCRSEGLRVRVPSLALHAPMVKRADTLGSKPSAFGRESANLSGST